MKGWKYHRKSEEKVIKLKRRINIARVRESFRKAFGLKMLQLSPVRASRLTDLANYSALIKVSRPDGEGSPVAQVSVRDL